MTVLVNMTPLVSVIVPAHNAVKFLPDAIASIRAQTYAPVEIVVVDDGSTDGTAALARTLGADIRVIEQPKRGPAAARNEGIRESTGEILAFLDADDLWTPDKLQRQVAALLENGADVVTGYIQLISLLGAESNLPHAPHRTRNAPYLDVNLGAMICRRAVFEKIGCFEESLHFAEDVDWYLRVLETDFRLVTVRALSLLYRRHPSNVTGTDDGAKAAVNTYLLVLRRAEERRGVTLDPNLDHVQFEAYLEAAPTTPMPSVTVILPVIAAYMQDADAWRRALDSLAEPDIPALDVVIVTREPLSLPALPLPAQIVTVESDNLPAHLNAGLQEALGDLVAFLTPDDIRAPGSITQQARAMNEFPFVDFVFGFRSFTLPDGVKLPPWLNDEAIQNQHFQASVGTLLARRALFEAEPFDSSYPLAYETAWFNAILDRGLPYHLLQDTVSQYVLQPSLPMTALYEAYLAELPRIRFDSIRRRRHEMKYRG